MSVIRPDTRSLDLTPEELQELQRLYAAQEIARQAYQDRLHETLEAYDVDHARLQVQFNPWTGRVLVVESPGAMGGLRDKRGA